MKVAITALLAAALCAPGAARAAHVYFDDYHDNSDDSGLADVQSLFRNAVLDLGHTIQEYDQEITKQALLDANADVLLLFDPDTTTTGNVLSQAEIAAIHSWLAVDCCRGLWVVGGKPGDFDDVAVNKLLAPYKVQFKAAGVEGDGTATFVGNHPTAQGGGTVSMYKYGELNPHSVAVCVAEDDAGRCVAVATNLYPIFEGRIAIWGDASSFKNDRFGTDLDPEGVYTGLTIDWLTEVMPLSVEGGSWGSVKALYR